MLRYMLTAFSLFPSQLLVGLAGERTFGGSQRTTRTENQHRSVFVNFAHRRNCPHSKMSASVKRAEQPHHSFKPARFVAIVRKTRYVQLSEDQTERQFTFAKRPSKPKTAHITCLTKTFLGMGLRYLEDVNAFPPSRGRNITTCPCQRHVVLVRLRIIWSLDKLSCCDLQSIDQPFAVEQPVLSVGSAPPDEGLASSRYARRRSFGEHEQCATSQRLRSACAPHTLSQGASGR